MERKSTRAGFNGVETADTPARCRVQELSMAAFYVRRTFMRVLIRRLSRQIVFLVPALSLGSAIACHDVTTPRD